MHRCGWARVGCRPHRPGARRPAADPAVVADHDGRSAAPAAASAPAPSTPATASAPAAASAAAPSTSATASASTAAATSAAASTSAASASAAGSAARGFARTRRPSERAWRDGAGIPLNGASRRGRELLVPVRTDAVGAGDANTFFDGRAGKAARHSDQVPAPQERTRRARRSSGGLRHSRPQAHPWSPGAQQGPVRRTSARTAAAAGQVHDHGGCHTCGQAHARRHRGRRGRALVSTPHASPARSARCPRPLRVGARGASAPGGSRRRRLVVRRGRGELARALAAA